MLSTPGNFPALRLCTASSTSSLSTGRPSDSWVGVWLRKLAVIEDSSGSILTESTAVLNRCTEFYAGLYNYKLHPDISLHQSNQILVVWANHSTPLHPVPLQPLPPPKKKKKKTQRDRQMERKVTLQWWHCRAWQPAQHGVLTATVTGQIKLINTSLTKVAWLPPIVHYGAIYTGKNVHAGYGISHLHCPGMMHLEWRWDQTSDSSLAQIIQYVNAAAQGAQLSWEMPGTSLGCGVMISMSTETLSSELTCSWHGNTSSRNQRKPFSAGKLHAYKRQHAREVIHYTVMEARKTKSMQCQCAAKMCKRMQQD